MTEQYWLLTADNRQPIALLGTEEQAEQYRTLENAKHDTNHYYIQAVSDADAAEASEVIQDLADCDIWEAMGA